MTTDLEKKYKPLVVVLSVAIPLVIAVLFTVRVEGYDTGQLPSFYAATNALTAVILIGGYVAIKGGQRQRHKTLMSAAIACSSLFLVLYVIYHLTSDSTVFGDLNRDGVRDTGEASRVGSMLYVYALLLLSHIALSLVVLPLVLMTYLKGWAGNLSSHRKWAAFTFPIWLFVAISGVIVFLMIRPYYDPQPIADLGDGAGASSLHESAVDISSTGGWPAPTN